jgi:hypothetical protein
MLVVKMFNFSSIIDFFEQITNVPPTRFNTELKRLINQAETQSI